MSEQGREIQPHEAQPSRKGLGRLVDRLIGSPKNQEKEGVDLIIEDLVKLKAIKERHLWLQVTYDLTQLHISANDDLVNDNLSLRALFQEISPGQLNNNRIQLLNRLIGAEVLRLLELTPSQIAEEVSQKNQKASDLRNNPSFRDHSWLVNSSVYEPGKRFILRLETNIPGIFYVVDVSKPEPDSRQGLKEYLEIRNSIEH